MGLIFGFVLGGPANNPIFLAHVGVPACIHHHFFSGHVGHRGPQSPGFLGVPRNPRAGDADDRMARQPMFHQGMLEFHRETSTYKGVPPSYVCWFINHSKYRYIYHKP